jgi:hypothetical protein
MNIVVLEDAAEDIEAGRHFYEACEEGVGDYFVQSILSDVESLVLYAGIHRKVFGFHRLLSKRFPYAIYYLVEADTSFVYGILDMRRNPTWIKNTLSQRGSAE